MDNTARGYPAIIPPEVRYDKDLSPNAKLLYGELTVLCHKEGYCWASNTYFAELYGVTKVSVSRWVAALKDKGYIQIELAPRDDTSKEVYRKIRLTNNPLTKMLRGVNKNDNTPQQNCYGGLTETTTPPYQNRLPPINKNDKENKERVIKQDELNLSQESNNQEEVHRPPEREIPPLPEDVLKYYMNHFNPAPSGMEKEKLAIWSEQYSPDQVKDAIDRGAEAEAMHINYIGKVLLNGGTRNGTHGQIPRRGAQRAPRQTGSDWSQVTEYRPGWQ